MVLTSNIVLAQRNIDPCTLFPNGTLLRHPDDCSQEIECVNFKSVNQTKCSGDKPFYDKDTNKCVKHLTDHSSCEIDCEERNGKFLQDPKSCDGYYYCQEDLALYGHCPPKMHFNETSQMCVYSSNSTCSFTDFDFCAITKKNQPFKYPSNCGKYYICKADKKGILTLTEEYCKGETIYYNALEGKCVEEPIEGCHPVPDKVCSTVKKNNNFVADGATCSGYFYCKDSKDQNPQWGKCPDNKFFYDGKCMDPLDAICFKDRCEGSNRRFVVSSQSGCRHYLTCKDGVKDGQGTCGNDFFDEIRGVCTSEIIKYKACYHP